MMDGIGTLPAGSPLKGGEAPVSPFSQVAGLAVEPTADKEAAPAPSEAGTPFTPFPTATIVPSPLGRRGCFTEAHGGHSFSRVPSLFARNEDRSRLMAGGAELPTEQPGGVASPATVHKDKLHKTFKLAKIQVDRELEAFLDDARAMLSADKAAAVRAGGEASPAATSGSRLEGVIMIAEQCQAEGVETFRDTIHAIVDQLEDLRRSCGVRSHKALATRLLFILTRCSRLVMSEEGRGGGIGSGGGGGGGAAYMTVQPRSKGPGKLRRFSGFPLLRGQVSLDRDHGRRAAETAAAVEQQAAGSPLLRSTTAPSRSFKEAMQGLHHLHLHDQQMRAVPPPLSPTPESPAQLASPASDVSALSHARALGLSPLGRSVVTALEAELEQAAAEGRKNVAREGMSPGGASPCSTGASPSGSPTKEKRSLLKLLAQQFRSLAGMGREGSSAASDMDAASDAGCGVGSSPESSGTPRILARKEPSPAAAAVPPPQQQQQQEKKLGAMQPRDTLQNLPTLHPRPQPSPNRRSMSADVETYGRPRTHPGLSRQLTVAVPPGSSAGSTPRRVALCHICRERVLEENLLQHVTLCPRLQELCRQDGDVDAVLTHLGNVIEDRLSDQSLGPTELSDSEDLLLVCRQAASLQPDGTRQPLQRCEGLASTVQALLDQADTPQPSLDAATEAFALRVRQLVQLKLEELQSMLPASRQLSDVGSGGSTPHGSSSSMSIDDFEIIKPISRGAFGRVYLARKRCTGDLFAIKVMRKVDLIRKNLVQSVKNERNILAMANNPFVVRFYYSFTSRENLYIVMEYLSGGDLFSLLRNLGALDEEVARQYVAETVLALEYCHTQGIIHRDLKPDNLLLSSNGHVKLTDFGLSCFGVIDSTDPHPRAMDIDSGSLPSSPRNSTRSIGYLSPEHLIQSPASKADLQDAARSPRLIAGREERGRAVGTPDYLAPELLLGTGHGLEVDWWSLGVILYEMVTGRPPFSADTPEEIFQNILDRHIEWPPEDEMSPECRDLIDGLLTLDFKQRLGHRGAGEVKLHPWFQGVGWASLARSKAAFIPALDGDTDTSYFSSKQVSQLSMALDLESSKSETDLPQSPLSLPGSRASSRAQSLRPSRRQTGVRRRSLRQALAEPSATSFASNASSGGSAGSRQSLAGDLPAGGLEQDRATAAACGPSAAEVAAALLQRHQLRLSGDGGGGGAAGSGVGACLPSRGQSTASMELDLGFEFVGGRMALTSDEQEGTEEGSGAGPPAGGGAMAGCVGSPLGSEVSNSSSEQGSSCGTRLTGGEGEGSYMELLGTHGGEDDPFAEFDRPPDPEAYRALHSATASPEKEREGG